MFNASQLGQALGGASHSTAARYLDALVDTPMVRRLPPHLVNLGKRPLAAGVDVRPVWDVAGLLADWAGQAG